MADLFNIGLSGLSVYSRAIAVTGNNVTNVNTEDYCRQTIQLSEIQGDGNAGLYIGHGVNMDRVKRMTDEYVVGNYRKNLTDFSEFDNLFKKANEIDRYLGDSNLNIAPGLENFFYALQTASNQPESIPARQGLMNQAQFLATRFNSIDGKLRGMLTDLNTSLSSATNEINNYLSEIATLNQQASVSTSANLSLQDKRDHVVNKLSQLIGVTTLAQDDGSLNIFTNSGLSLVIGGVVNTLTTIPDPAQPDIHNVVYVSSGHTLEINQSDLSGGTVGGLLRYRSEVLSPTIQTLDRLATGLEYSLNEQHQRGMDLNNRLGGFFLNDINSSSAQSSRVYSQTSNTGTAALTVTVTDPSALTDDGYRMVFMGGSTYQLTNLRTQAISTYNTGLPLSINGVSIQLSSGTPAVNDAFMVNPVRYAARDMRLQITDPASFALAAPIRTAEDPQNTGTGVISMGTVSDITNASFATQGALSPPLTIEFLSSNTYRVLNSTTGSAIQTGPLPYVVGQSNELFPLPAFHTSIPSGLFPPGTLPLINVGELTLNGTAIAPALADGVSTSDSSGSALAIAATINLGTATHGVTAIVNPNEFNLGVYTGGALAGAQFQINGQNIVAAGATQQDLLDGIAAVSGTTGVTASVNSLNQIVLTATDGRNIQLTTNGTSGAATFSGFSLTGPASNGVTRGTVSLSQATGSIVVAGTAPGDAGFTADTYSAYDPGYRVQMTGAPNTGDRFMVEYNTNGRSDNRNALLLLQVQQNKLFDGNQSTVNELFTQLVSRIGSDTHSAEMSRESSESQVRQLKDDLEKISGVNLDEEAANLMLFEQAYRASSQLIRTGQTIIDVIFDMIR